MKYIGNCPCCGMRYPKTGFTSKLFGDLVADYVEEHGDAKKTPTDWSTALGLVDVSLRSVGTWFRDSMVNGHDRIIVLDHVADSDTRGVTTGTRIWIVEVR